VALISPMRRPVETCSLAPASVGAIADILATNLASVRVAVLWRGYCLFRRRHDSDIACSPAGQLCLHRRGPSDLHLPGSTRGTWLLALAPLSVDNVLLCIAVAPILHFPHFFIGPKNPHPSPPTPKSTPPRPRPHRTNSTPRSATIGPLLSKGCSVLVLAKSSAYLIALTRHG
jgi:hypothetical protein